MALALNLPHGIHAQTVMTDLRATRHGGIALARRFWYGVRHLWWHSYWHLSADGLDQVPARGAMLLCANHASHLDAPAILASLAVSRALPASTAAALDVWGMRPLPRLASRVMTNAVSIRRGGEFAGGLRTLEAVLRERRPLVIFPEGRRSVNGRLSEFKHGPALLALRTGAPIVPIHIEGTRASLPKRARLPKPGSVQVRFGAPIDPRPYQRAVAAGTMDRRTAQSRLTAELKRAIIALGANESACSVSTDRSVTVSSPVAQASLAG